MHVLIAPTSFKGSLSARDAAAAIELGVRDAATRLGVAITTDLCPIGDGGEGTAEILATALNGRRRTTRVTGPLDGGAVEAEWFWCERVSRPALGGMALAAPVAIFDSAHVVGLPLVPAARRDPARVSTRGIGELIAGVRDAGAASVIVGLGGTASVDGGIGAASAQGWSFLDENGAALDPIGASLGAIARVQGHGAGNGASIIALSDVTNPLCGPRGAARTFGPQKGATPAQVEALEAGLANLAARAREAGLDADPGAPGAGAAGGLGFGLAAFLAASVLAGAPAVLDALDVERRLAGADLAITGEGSLDDQTSQGKAIGALAELAARAGVALAAIAGQVRGEPGRRLSLARVSTLVGAGVSRERAEGEAARLLRERAAALVGSMARR